ncbi:hypothetical protein [Paenibacillus sp. FSL R7-0333]|uniref:hypothetical protein n=1 Tax=Paenibacillus sp. FSL R7-0333 TaxID=1926587 RepID=UPI00097A7596|nr:hypothetical protein BK146_17840 [Paenibacillus sp. FSL R7-0333]
MTQTPRDWQKDMEMCERVKDAEWLILDHTSAAYWQRGGLMSTIWEGVDAEALQQHKAALPYWLQEAKVYKQSYEATLTQYTAEKARADAAEAREQQLKEAAQLAVNDLELWNDKILAAKVVLGQLQRMLSTLYPDTPAQPVEEKLPEWTKVKSREDGMIYTIHDATETNNQFGYGIYRYRVKERLDTGFALHKKWFDVISDTPAPKEGSE